MYRCGAICAGPLLDEREKSRLAELMRFRGKMPEVTPEQQAAAAKHGEGLRMPLAGELFGMWHALRAVRARAARRMPNVGFCVLGHTQS